MLKLLTYTRLLFSGSPKTRFQQVRKSRNLQGLVDIHHIIPKQCHNHPTIRMSKYDIENGYNLMFLPTLAGSIKIKNLHFSRPIHMNSHKNYNKFVIEVLDEMFLNSQINEYNLCKLNRYLRQNMRHLEIPWN